MGFPDFPVNLAFRSTDVTSYRSQVAGRTVRFRTISPRKKGGKRVARILVVEDELALRRVITLNLVRRGYTVAEADSVVTAE